MRTPDLAPPAGLVVQKGSAGAPPGVCRSGRQGLAPAGGPHVEPEGGEEGTRQHRPIGSLVFSNPTVGWNKTVLKT